jgi:hypothetical protein
MYTCSQFKNQGKRGRIVSSLSEALSTTLADVTVPVGGHKPTDYID